MQFIVSRGNRCLTVAIKCRHDGTWKCSHDTTDIYYHEINIQCTWAECSRVHWTYRAKPTHDRSHMALIAQMRVHCTGNEKVVDSNPVQSLELIFSGLFLVALWLHSHLWCLNCLLLKTTAIITFNKVTRLRVVQCTSTWRQHMPIPNPMLSR